MFFQFLEAFDYDLSYEWFYNYFQDEHADRKNNKQDFTPVCVSNLISEMLNCKVSKDDYTIISEPAAGTGSYDHCLLQTYSENHGSHPVIQTRRLSIRFD